MEGRRVRVFFYGLFMDVDLLRDKGVLVSDVRRARVDGMALRIGDRATLVPDERASVEGFVMSLNHDDIRRLYSESSVAMYQPEGVIAALDDGTSTAALCFNLPAAPSPGTSNPQYASKLADLGRRLGLSPSYLATIKSQG